MDISLDPLLRLLLRKNLNYYLHNSFFQRFLSHFLIQLQLSDPSQLNF